MNSEFLWTILSMSFLISLILTVIAIPKVIKIAFEKQLFDVPDYRKVHTGQVPRLGGVTFLPGIMIAVFVVSGFICDIIRQPELAELSVEMMYGAAGALFLYMTGVTDDLVGLSYKVKFPVQIISACLLCAAGLWIDNFHGILGIHEIPPVIGVPFTVVVIVLIINAINLIDGIDGLASGLCILGITAFSILFIREGLVRYALIGISALGALLPFYIYNVYGTSNKRTKIFMGDAGSLTMGYIISAFTIKGATFAEKIPADGPDQTFCFVYAFAILLVPILDVVRLFVHRIIHRRSPFSPDRCHIHHKFMAVGMSIGTARHTIIGISLVFFLFNIFMIRHVDINILLLTDVVLWTFMHIMISRRIHVLQQRHAKSAESYKE